METKRPPGGSWFGACRRREHVSHLRLFCVALLLFTCCVGACKRSPAPSASSDKQRAPLPAPEGLVSELFIPHPDRTWEMVRTTLRAETTLVPSSPAVFLGGALGLPIAALEQLDFNIPMVGAVVDEKGALAALLALHVKDGPRLIEQMTTGTPRFVKEEKPESDVTLLLPPPSDTTGLFFAVSGNYLVAGSNRDALSRCAAFVTRTLPGRSVPTEDLVAVSTRAALAGPVSERLTKLWRAWKQDREAEDLAMRAKHGGSAPDFGDPAQALADIDAKAGRFLAVLGSLDEARLAVSIDPARPGAGTRYRAVMSMKASRPGPAAEEMESMVVASAEPLLSLPSSVGIGFLTRDNAALRAQSSAAQVEAIEKVLGGRLLPNDKTKVESAFRAWSTGRGDWLSGGLSVNGSSLLAVARGAVADAAALSEGALAMLDLLNVRAIAEPLSNWVGSMKLGGLEAARTAADGAVRTVRVTRTPPKVKLRTGRDKPAENDAFDIVWSVDRELFVGVAGRDARQAHALLQKNDSDQTLGRVSYVKSAIQRLGPNVAFALLFDSSRFGASERSRTEDGALLLAYGKDPKENGRAWLELDAPAALVTSYGKSASALLGSHP